jgi:hypothetical protein
MEFLEAAHRSRAAQSAAREELILLTSANFSARLFDFDLAHCSAVWAFVCNAEALFSLAV